MLIVRNEETNYNCFAVILKKSNVTYFHFVYIFFSGLTLVSAPHLARSYHHLFPPEPFRELLTADIMTDGNV